jgi:signal transduction histidine kinase
MKQTNDTLQSDSALDHQSSLHSAFHSLFQVISSSKCRYLNAFPYNIIIILTFITLVAGRSLQLMQLFLFISANMMHLFRAKFFSSTCDSYLDIIVCLVAYYLFRTVLPQYVLQTTDETAALLSICYLYKQTQRSLIAVLGLCLCYLYFHNSSVLTFGSDQLTKDFFVHLHYYGILTIALKSSVSAVCDDHTYASNINNRDGKRQFQHSQDENFSEFEPKNMVLGISHDANNLLHSLLTNINLLDLEMKSRKHWTELSEGLLRSAASSAEHLRYLITQVLDLSLDNKHDSHIISNKVNYTELNITEPLRRLRAMVLPECKRKGLRLEVRLEEVTPIQVKMDEDRLMQILLNLVGNAIKFTEKGEISVGVAWRTNKEVRQEEECDEETMEVYEDDSFGLMPVAQKVRKMVFTSRRLQKIPQRSIIIGDTEEHNRVLQRMSMSRLMQDEEGELVVWVTDTGCGISEENLQKIFNKGERVHRDGEPRRSGRGLGLWYIKYILHLMQGKIQVKSVVNLGTRFIITIPCTAAGSS